MLFDRYEKYQKYINGVPASPPEYMKGEYLGQYEFPSLEDCEAGAQYRWVETGGTICVDYSLCKEEKKQVSTDGGQTWQDTDDRRGGAVIEEHSVECGWHILEEWRPTGREVCQGYNLYTEYERFISEDMGDTWVGTGEYIYKIKEYMNYDCAMQEEPLTYQIEVTEDTTTVAFDNTLEGVTNKYYVDWGDEEHEIATYDENKTRNHVYNQGTYIVKFWGLINIIGDAYGVDKTITSSIISWGTANWEEIQEDASYTGTEVRWFSDKFQVNIGKSATVYKGDMWYYPSTVNISRQTSIVSDTTEGLKYMSVFIAKGLLNDIPAGLFDNATQLIYSDFSESNIISVPSFLYKNTQQILFNETFANCKLLKTVGDSVFTSKRSTTDYYPCFENYYNLSQHPAIKCRDAISADDPDPKNIVANCVYCSVLVGTNFNTSTRWSYKTFESPSIAEAEEIIWYYNTPLPRPLMAVGDHYSATPSSANRYPYGLIDFNDMEMNIIPQSVVWSPKTLSTAMENIDIAGYNYIDRIPECYNFGTPEFKFDASKYFMKDLKYRDSTSVDIALKNIEWEVGEISPQYANQGIILYGVFKGCSSLTTVGPIAGASDTIVRTDYMFSGCSSLLSVPNFLGVCKLGGLDLQDSGSGKANGIINFTMDYMFEGCTSLKEIWSWPSTINWPEIPDYTLRYYENGKGEIEGKNISTIGMYARSGIEVAELTENDLEYYTFTYFLQECSSLTTVNFPSKVLEDISYICDGCENLINVNISGDIAEHSFSRCIRLENISGIHISHNANYAFEGDISILNVPDTLFNINPEQDNLTAQYIFSGCHALQSVANTLIADVDREQVEYPIVDLLYAFQDCYSLNNYPTSNGKAIWDWDRFYYPEDPNGDDYVTNYAFYGCAQILNDVPFQWGGLKENESMNRIDFKVNITSNNEEIIFNNVSFHIQGTLYTETDNGAIIPNPGQYIVNILAEKTSSYTFPVQTIEIQGIGDLQELENYKNCTYICSGEHLWETRTNLDGIFKDCTALVNVDDDIFKNCTNVNQMNYPFENCALPEDKVTTIMGYITTLTNADYILRNKDFISTCGIVDNNPNLISMNYAFDNMPNLTTLPSNFPTSLTQMDGAFRYAISLEGEAPDLWTRSGLSGIWAFGGCKKLTNYSTIDQKWGGNPHLYCKATGTDECEISMNYGELVTDLGINAGVYYWMKNDAISALKNYGPVPSREVNIYKIGNINIQGFEYRSEAENVEIYG